MNAPPQETNASRRPLALILLSIAVTLAIAFRFIPTEYRLANFAPVGAMFLFVGARVRPGIWYLLPFITMLGTDLYFYEVQDWNLPFLNYGCYMIYLLLGYQLLRKSESPVRIPVVALIGSVQFFLLSNFSVWVEHAIRPDQFGADSYPVYAPNSAGLMHCFQMGWPFYRGTFLSDIVFTGMFFSAYAVLARAYFQLERVPVHSISETNS